MPIPNIPEKHAQANQGWVGRAKKRAIKKEIKDGTRTCAYPRASWSEQGILSAWAVDLIGVTKVRVAASETSLAQDEQRLRIQAEDRCTKRCGAQIKTMSKPEKRYWKVTGSCTQHQ